MHKPTQLIRSMLLIVSLALTLAACSRATPTSLIQPFPTIPNVNKIETIPCPFDTPGEATVTCGKLAVPEDYMDPRGAQIHLMVATVHSTGASPATDPVIVMLTDPGGLILEFMRYVIYDPLLAEILKERDLVFYDMRGVGYSEPDTTCPDVAQAQYDDLGKKESRDSRAKASAEIMLDCHRKLVQAGVHLEFYTTAQNVADLNAVKDALGVDRVNLLGIGYGSYLSMRVMQDYPERIRSALLSSPYNDQIIGFDIAANLQRVLTLAFGRCKADERCNAAYPSLEEDFYAVIEKLNRTPAEITITVNNKTVPVAVTGDMFLDLTRSMASRSDIATLPKLVEDIKNDRAYNLMTPFQNYLGYNEYQSFGIVTTVYCQAFLESKGKQRPAGKAHQALRDWQGLGQQTDEQICSSWFTGKTEPSENPGRPSSIPALVLSGEWNSYVPPDWVKENVKSLGGVKLVEFANTGWVYWGGDCLTQLATAFLKDPATELDAGCAKETPAINFILPLK